LEGRPLSVHRRNKNIIIVFLSELQSLFLSETRASHLITCFQELELSEDQIL